MKAGELLNIEGIAEVSIADKDAEITKVYCCDLLSIVMGKAPAGSAWVTVMGNVNAVAVASLAEIGAIIVAQNSAVDEIAIQKAEQNGINIFKTELPIFDAALKINGAL